MTDTTTDVSPVDVALELIATKEGLVRGLEMLAGHAPIFDELDEWRVSSPVDVPMLEAEFSDRLYARVDEITPEILRGVGRFLLAKGDELAALVSGSA